MIRHRGREIVVPEREREREGERDGVENPSIHDKT